MEEESELMKKFRSIFSNCCKSEFHSLSTGGKAVCLNCNEFCTVEKYSPTKEEWNHLRYENYLKKDNLLGYVVFEDKDGWLWCCNSRSSYANNLLDKGYEIVFSDTSHECVEYMYFSNCKNFILL